MSGPLPANALPLPGVVALGLGLDARLAEPGALRLLGIAALVLALGALGLVRRRRALRRTAGGLGPRIAPGANTLRPAIRLGLSSFGLALLAVALVRPQCGTRTELARRYGVDVVVALDASRSMTARDVRPDRLGRAKLEVGALLDGLGGDRVGVVAFAGSALVQCPLTTDYEAARLFLRAADPDALPDPGTSIAAALAAAKGLLDTAERGARSKIVLLVTDGEDHAGEAASTARALSEAGVRVDVLAVGTESGATLPVVDAQGRVTGERKDRRGETIVSRLDALGLAEIARAGGGALHRVDAPGGGAASFRAALERLERSELEGRLVTVYEERYALAAAPALLLLLAGLLLPEGRAVRGREGAP